MKYKNIVLSLFMFTVSCGRIVDKWTVNIPVQADDVNAVTFDSEDISFATVITDDKDSAHGGLSVVDVLGNKMLKFTDDMTVDIDGKVQKICINTAELLGTERLSEVRSIEFDVYADAVSDDYINQDGINKKASGTICIGGGTVISKGKWYDFAETQGGEYNLEMSGAVHCEFKFLLADSGYCWDESMNDANFLIMRWGSENQSNLYVDNIVFYDENKNSIPLA
ncbi:MAG: hypothetical protein K2G36_10485 [Ruminococcus sp.]|nr:hypothetical protein [Ruminococcus sp.]